MAILSDAVSHVSLGLPGLVTLAVAGIATLLVYRRFLSPIRHIPGPYLGSLGRLWYTWQILKGHHTDTMVALHDELGPFVRVANNEVSVCHPDAVKKILGAPLRKTLFYTIFHLPDLRYPSGQTILDARQKTTFRRPFAAGYAAAAATTGGSGAETRLDAAVAPLLGWLDRHAASGEPLALDRFLLYTANDAVGAQLFSRPFGFLEAGDDIDGTLAAIPALSRFLAVAGDHVLVLVLWFALLANPLVTALGLLPLGHLVNTTFAALDGVRPSAAAAAAGPGNAEAKDADSHGDDMLAHWRRAVAAGRTTERRLRATTVGTVGGGGDTVAAALQACVYHMVRPRRHGDSDVADDSDGNKNDLWQRVRAEIATERARGRCGGRIVAAADARRLPLLNACVKEALRVFPPVPQGLPRVVPAGGLVFGGDGDGNGVVPPLSLPPGTRVSVGAAVMHRAAALWGPDAGEFRPDRWFEAGSEERERRYFMPFGAGPHTCPGQQLAKVEIPKVLATLVRDYDIRLVDPARGWQWAAYFTAHSHSWPVYVKKRSE